MPSDMSTHTDTAITIRPCAKGDEQALALVGREGCCWACTRKTTMRWRFMRAAALRKWAGALSAWAAPTIRMSSSA